VRSEAHAVLCVKCGPLLLGVCSDCFAPTSSASNVTLCFKCDPLLIGVNTDSCAPKSSVAEDDVQWLERRHDPLEQGAVGLMLRLLPLCIPTAKTMGTCNSRRT